MVHPSTLSRLHAHYHSQMMAMLTTAAQMQIVTEVNMHAQLGISAGRDTTGERYSQDVLSYNTSWIWLCFVIKCITLKFVNGLLINTSHVV